LGDLALFSIVEGMIDDYNFAAPELVPKLYAHKQRIAAIPNIAAYISGDRRYPVRKLQ
jgi:hypothetical protein